MINGVISANRFLGDCKIFIFGYFLVFSFFLTGCSFLNQKNNELRPKDLGVNISVFPIKQVWSTKIGAINEVPLAIRVNDTAVTIASADGVIAAVDARTGKDVWRAMLKEPLSAGVGSDGRFAAVVSSANELIVLDSGRERWRYRLAAQVFTSPLVAGSRVFVLTADHGVVAFDAGNGKIIWSQQKTGENLVLRQSGVLIAVGDVLVTGISGKLIGLNPDNGVVRWSVPLSIPRGANEIERLVELVGKASRIKNSVCVRSFQTAVGCVDISRGTVTWIQKANGVDGVDGDSLQLYGSESNGILSAWNRVDGSIVWMTERLQNRRLTAPLLLGRSVVVGDDRGEVHFLSRENASPLNRFVTDSSGISVSPVVAADTLVVMSRAGYVYGFRPD